MSTSLIVKVGIHENLITLELEKKKQNSLFIAAIMVRIKKSPEGIYKQTGLVNGGWVTLW